MYIFQFLYYCTNDRISNIVNHVGNRTKIKKIVFMPKKTYNAKLFLMRESSQKSIQVKILSKYLNYIKTLAVLLKPRVWVILRKC